MMLLLAYSPITLSDIDGLRMILAAHNVGLERQLRQLLEWTMEDGSLSFKAWRQDNPETG